MEYHFSRSDAEKKTAKPDFVMLNENMSIIVENHAAPSTPEEILEEILDKLKAGDTLHISEFSDIAKSVNALGNMLTDLNNKGIRVISDKENFDSGSEEGKTMFRAFSVLFQFDKENRARLRYAGIKIAKEKGLYKGRKKLDRPARLMAYYKRLSEGQITHTKMAKELGISRATLYKMIGEYEKEKGISKNEKKDDNK